jgi:hypothetical protein
MKSRAQRRRERLMAEDPHCRNCGVEVVYFVPQRHETIPGNFATLEHVNSRNQRVADPRTGKLARPVHGQITLWCSRCNNDRSAAELAAMPRDVVWQQSRSFPGSGWLGMS